MFPELPDELKSEIASSGSDCRTVIQACTAISKSMKCDEDKVWEKAARKLDVSARSMWKDYNDGRPAANSVWSSERIPHDLRGNPNPSSMTKPEFVDLCKLATMRTKFLSYLRKVRDWMNKVGWNSLSGLQKRKPIDVVELVFQDQKRMTPNGCQIILKMHRTGKVELKHREYIRASRSFNGDEQVYSWLHSVFMKIIKTFASSPNLDGGKIERYQNQRAYVVKVRPE